MLEKIKNLFLLCIFIIKITNAFNISHINYIPLINENFLLINKTAVYIKDKNFREIKKKYIFENNDKKLIKKYDNDLDFDFQYFIQDNKIFIFIKKYMYIFSNKGNFIKKCKIFEHLPNNNYIILPYESVSKKLNIFFYLAIYMNNDDNIVFRVYEYDFFYNINIINYNSHINLNNLSLLKPKYFDNKYVCQLINISINDNKEILTYFLKKKNELDIIPETFEINIIKKDKVFNLIKPNNKSKNKGEINDTDSKYQEKALICNMNNKNKYYCIINHLKNNDFFEFNNISNNCSSKLYYEHITDLNKFIFYCFDSKVKLTIIELNDQFEFKSKKNFQIEDIDFINDYNYFYLFYKQKNYQILLINDNRDIRFLELNEIKEEINLRQLEEPEGEGQNPNPKPESGQQGGDKKGNGETSDGKFDFDNKNSTIPKDKINDNREHIIKNTKPGESYELKGDGYEIKIAPMGQSEEGTTSIDFSSCEEKLREKYCTDSSNCTLTVFQTETSNSNEKSLTNNVKYVVYGENNTKLDLSVCQDEKISINYALKENSNLNLTMYSEFSNMGIDILNSSDAFFNDICYSYSDGTSDMILSDRIAEIYQNYSLCDSGCDYEGINVDDSTVSCSCSITSDDSDDEDESENLKDIFLDLFENSTFGVVKCYKLVFGSSNKGTNIGFWFFLIIIIGHIPLYILFFKDGTSLIINYIKNEMKKYHYLININLDNPPKKNNNNVDNISENQTDRNIVKKSENVNFAKNTSEAGKNEENEETDKNFNITPNNIILKNEKITQNIKGVIETTKENDLIDNEISSKREIKDIFVFNKNNKNDEKKNKSLYYLIHIDADNSSNNEKPPDSNYTLKNYEYESALKYENRTFWRILYIVILSKDHILKTFILKSPLESQPLRICLLLFSYSCDLALNTLFYFSDNISDKYHYTGNHLFWYTLYNNILISVISTLLSLILGMILEIMTDSKKSIEDDFKEEEKKMREDHKYKVSDERKKEIMEKIHKIVKNLKIKMIIFIVIDFIILLFFFYFVTAFCEVYQSTQTSWISDAVVSIIISFPIEIAIALVVTIFYQISLKYECKFLYKLSMMIA